MDAETKWDSSLSFIFAMIGAAVGLGNIWRFSYVVYSNGGGSFFFPYFCAILVMGIPFLILEYGIGFKFKESFSNILKSIKPRFEIIAWILVSLVFVIIIYYMVILGWDFVYFLNSFTFGWGSDTATFFTNSVGGSSNLTNFNLLLLPTAIAVLILWFILWIISRKSVDGGIGLVSKILIPLLFSIMAIIVLYSLTLPGANIGVNALLKPNWKLIFDINIWLAAFAQIIFSLSMGQAIALTYSSYLPENSKLTDNVFLVVFSNSFFEIFTAFGVFSILGFMSVTSSIPIDKLVSEGTGLVFIVFPMIFNVMGPVARLLAPLFFLAILFAGITSSLGFFEPVLNTISNKFKWPRKKTSAILCFIGCCFSLLLTTGISSYIVGIIDSFVNQFGILLLIGIQSIIFGYVYGVEKVLPILNQHSIIKVGKKWVFIIKYLLPIVLIGMWVVGIVKLFHNASLFEISVDLIIVFCVFVFSFILTKINLSSDS